MLWATPQPGNNPNAQLNVTSLSPGDDYDLLDGTETVATGSKSVAFARATSRRDADNGASFYVTGCANGTQIEIQGSAGVPGSQTFNLANFDASFLALYDLAAGNGTYTDIGRASFYRALVKVFVGGDAPVVRVKR